MSGKSDSARETREIDPEMKRGIAELGFLAMHRLGEKDKNFVASPLSAFAALCMCPPLFTGETRQELERPLGLSAGESNECFIQRVAAFQLPFGSDACFDEGKQPKLQFPKLGSI